MDIELEPGKYLVAVSGGVDSVALLYLLSQMKQQDGSSYSFVVAHYDHGIRTDSKLDRKLVQGLANMYGIPFVSEAGNLGADTSEALAREKRYIFLDRARKSYGAGAIITAHHQDDLLETALLNILRGTGRKGLTSLGNRQGVRRPLLHISKSQLIRYAKEYGLEWHEDSTNTDEKYTRNYIRRHIMPKLDAASRAKLLDIICNMQLLNCEIDERLVNILHVQDSHSQLHRSAVMKLSHAEAKELFATWLRLNDISDFDSKVLERLVIGAKTKHTGAKIDILNKRLVVIKQDHLALMSLDC